MILKTNKVYYIDTFSRSSFHEIFNASLLVMCSKIFDEVYCKLNNSSLLAIEQRLKQNLPNNIQTKNVFVVKGITPYHLMLRYFISAILNVFYLIKTPKNAIIIFPYNNVFGIRLLNLVNKVIKKKIIIFCHGEMECVATDLNKGGIISKLVITFSRNFFKNKKIKMASNLHFSFMGEKILENISPFLTPEILAKTIIVDHPYIFDYKDEESNNKELDVKETNKKLNIGTTGVFSTSRGLNLFYEWIKDIPETLKNQLHITVIGSVTNYYQELNNLDVEILNRKGNNSLLDRVVFESAIEKLDYILFFYDTQSYKFTPSGAVLDALKFNKPIISLRNDYFDYIFKKYGNFGYLLKSTDEINTILLDTINETKVHVFDFGLIKSQLDPKKLFIQFENELKKIQYI